MDSLPDFNKSNFTSLKVNRVSVFFSRERNIGTDTHSEACHFPNYFWFDINRKQRAEVSTLFLCSHFVKNRKERVLRSLMSGGWGGGSKVMISVPYHFARNPITSVLAKVFGCCIYFCVHQWSDFVNLKKITTNW